MGNLASEEEMVCDGDTEGFIEFLVSYFVIIDIVFPIDNPMSLRVGHFSLEYSELENAARGDEIDGALRGLIDGVFKATSTRGLKVLDSPPDAFTF